MEANQEHDIEKNSLSLSFVNSKYGGVFIFLSLASFCLILYSFSLFVLSRICNLSYYDGLQNYRCPFDHGAYFLPILAAVLFSFLITGFLVFRQDGSKVIKIIKILVSYVLLYLATFAISSAYPAYLFGEDFNPIDTVIFFPFLGLVFVLAIASIALFLVRNRSSGSFTSSWLAKPAVSVVAVIILAATWLPAYIYATSVESNYRKLQKIEQENFCQFVAPINLQVDLSSREFVLNGGKTQGSFRFEATRNGHYTFFLSVYGKVTDGNSYHLLKTKIERDLTISSHVILFEMSLIDPDVSIPDQRGKLNVTVKHNLQEPDLQELNKIHPAGFNKYGYRGNFNLHREIKCFSDSKVLLASGKELELNTVIEGVSIVNQRNLTPTQP